jgi:hypothetical protein
MNHLLLSALRPCVSECFVSDLSSDDASLSTSRLTSREMMPSRMQANSRPACTCIPRLHSILSRREIPRTDLSSGASSRLCIVGRVQQHVDNLYSESPERLRLRAGSNILLCNRGMCRAFHGRAGSASRPRRLHIGPLFAGLSFLGSSDSGDARRPPRLSRQTHSTALSGDRQR